MDTADNTTPAGVEATGSAPGAELSIPKHRFDEVSAEVKRLRDEVAIKDRLYLEERQRMSEANRPRQVAPEITPEDVGLDPQTFSGVKKLAARLAEEMVQQKTAVYEQQIGILANRTENAEFLASKGSDKAKYLPRMTEERQKHYQRTGTFMSNEVAYELIRSEEREARIKFLEAKLAGQNPVEPQAQQTQAPVQQSYQAPVAAGTRQMPTGGAAQAQTAAKGFSESSLEEMEARLEEQFRTGQRL